jgi:hypothetical protein
VVIAKAKGGNRSGYGASEQSAFTVLAPYVINGVRIRG